MLNRHLKGNEDLGLVASEIARIDMKKKNKKNHQKMKKQFQTILFLSTKA